MKKTILGCIAALLLLVGCGDGGGYKTTIHVDFKDERIAPLIIADGRFFKPHWQQNTFVMYNKLEMGKTYEAWIDGDNGENVYLLWDVREVK